MLISGKPDSGCHAKAEFDEDFIPVIENITEPYRIKVVWIVLGQGFFFDLLVAGNRVRLGMR